jgi:hypothetical protein
MHIGRVKSPLSAQSFSAVINGAAGLGSGAGGGSGATGVGAGSVATLGWTISDFFALVTADPLRRLLACVLGFVTGFAAGAGAVGGAGDGSGMITGDGMETVAATDAEAGAVVLTAPLTGGFGAVTVVSMMGVTTGATTAGAALPE